MRYANDVRSMQVTRSLAMSGGLSGAMICVRGNAIGSMVSLKSDRKLLVGRDRTSCNYVVTDQKVSRKHLEITYIGALNKYLVVDCSRNGTFLQNGTRLNKEQEYYLPPRTELWLGSSDTVYKLK